MPLPGLLRKLSFKSLKSKHAKDSTSASERSSTNTSSTAESKSVQALPPLPPQYSRSSLGSLSQTKEASKEITREASTPKPGASSAPQPSSEVKNDTDMPPKELITGLSADLMDAWDASHEDVPKADGVENFLNKMGQILVIRPHRTA